MSDSLQSHGLQPAKLLCPWEFPGKNTGVGCHSLLQGIFPTQGIKPASPALAGGFFTSEPPGMAHLPRHESWSIYVSNSQTSEAKSKYHHGRLCKKQLVCLGTQVCFLLFYKATKMRLVRGQKLDGYIGHSCHTSVGMRCPRSRPKSGAIAPASKEIPLSLHGTYSSSLPS